jgi:hypothetical protein
LSKLNRIILLSTAILASYQVVRGIDGLGTMAIACYTIGFGVIIIASLLIMILGFEVLDSSLVVIASTLIPLSLSLGLISGYFRTGLIPFGIFFVVGFCTILITRLTGIKKLAVIVLVFVHGVAGLTISFLPVILVVRGIVPAGFVFVSIGGGFTGLGGLLISFLKMGKPVLSRERILAVFPVLIILTFVIGFSFI